MMTRTTMISRKTRKGKRKRQKQTQKQKTRTTSKRKSKERMRKKSQTLSSTIEDNDAYKILKVREQQEKRRPTLRGLQQMELMRRLSKMNSDVDASES